jgi:hypothetical protein
MMDFLIGFLLGGGGRGNPAETESERRERIRAMLVLSALAALIGAIIIAALLA